LVQHDPTASRLRSARHLKDENSHQLTRQPYFARSKPYPQVYAFMEGKSHQIPAAKLTRAVTLFFTQHKIIVYLHYEIALEKLNSANFS
jgi:hypothetical protein